MTRNQINRFDASTKDGALYTERSNFEGNTSLEIMVRKEQSLDYEALIGVLQIVIKDIQNGYLAIGGETSVGRGIFSGSEDSTIYMNASNEEDYYGKALYKFISEGI